MSGFSGLIFRISAGNTDSLNRAMLEQIYGGGELALTKTPAQRPDKRLRINQLAQKT
jgi:hypothetical protein